jgi:hypothetical protein
MTRYSVLLCFFGLTAVAGVGTRVYVRPDAPEPEVFAQKELVRYLRAMGNAATAVGADPQHANILVGSTAAGMSAADGQALLKRMGTDTDAIALRSAGGKLMLLGGSPRAVLYAAYRYLESLGARWYFPGAESEVLPRAEARTRGYDMVEHPSFAKRGIVIFARTPGFAEQVDWAAKNRLNTIALHSDEGLAGARKVVESRGLTLELERHFFGEQFCLDDAALRAQQSTFLDYVAKLPVHPQEYFLWPADRYATGCDSERDRGYSVPDLVLRFTNRMAAALRTQQPGARMAYLSYLTTWTPPVREKPGEGVMLEWAPIFQSFACSIADPECAASRDDKANFEALLRVFRPEEAQVLGYWLDDTIFTRTAYQRLPFAPEALSQDLRYYRARGVRKITTFGVIAGRDYFMYHASPVVFLYPALLWDIETPVRERVADFCERYFGDRRLKRVYDLLERADWLVPVEKHKIRTEKLTSAEFRGVVVDALRMAVEFTAKQDDAVRRARGARLVGEVSSRMLAPGREEQ